MNKSWKIVNVLLAILLLLSDAILGQEVENVTSATDDLGGIMNDEAENPELTIDPEHVIEVTAEQRATELNNDSLNEDLTTMFIDSLEPITTSLPIPKPPGYTKHRTFMEYIEEVYIGFTTLEEAAQLHPKEVICIPRNITDNSSLEVRLVNSSALLTVLGNKTHPSAHCTVVLFYAPWCMFCANVAPFYNALARAYPQLNILAIESTHFTSLNTRYGTISVPNILVFYNNSKGISRFNHTDRTFDTFKEFVKNVTGFSPDGTVEVLPGDYDGPLSSNRSEDPDWLLWLSWIFVIVFFISVFVKSTPGQNIINALSNFGVEHHHHID